MILFTEYDNLRGINNRQFEYLLDVALLSLKSLYWKYNRSSYMEINKNRFKTKNKISPNDSLYMWCKQSKSNVNMLLSILGYKRSVVNRSLRDYYYEICDLSDELYCEKEELHEIFYKNTSYPILLEEIYKPLILRRIKRYKQYIIKHTHYGNDIRCLKDIYVMMLNRFHYCEKHPNITEEKPSWYDYTMKELQYFKEKYGHLYKKRSKM